MVQEPEAVNEFISIYEREFGVKLPFEEAKFKAEKLIRIVRKAVFNAVNKGEINHDGQ